MRTKFFLVISLFVFAGASVSGQTKTGTLKLFSNLQGITVFLDENKQETYQEIKGIPVGTHYLKVINSDGSKLYGNIITIVQDEVTTILIEGPAVPVQAQQKVTGPVVEKPAAVNTGATGKTGTLNIFSEFTDIVVYLDENRQGENIRQINSVPAGNHYLKVMKDGVSVLAELITINEGQTTTVLVKNDGQVAEKILSSKVDEINAYKNDKLEVLLSTGSQTYTKGSSTLFPGYYSYWGYSNSVSTTVGTTDWKIIKGGVKEISEREFAGLIGNQPLMEQIDLSIKKENKTTGIAALIALPCIIMATLLLVDATGSKPLLHKDDPVHPKWEAPVAAGSITIGAISYLVAMKKPYSGHYTTVDSAAKEAQEYNKKLKAKLGLPADYDIQ